MAISERKFRRVVQLLSQGEPTSRTAKAAGVGRDTVRRIAAGWRPFPGVRLCATCGHSLVGERCGFCCER